MSQIGSCAVPSTVPACKDYGVCGFVDEYESWAMYAACLMGNNLSVSLILAQWGDESGWGGSDICTAHNPGNQGSTCGIGGFDTLQHGVESYANLMAQGYPFVGCTFTHYFNEGDDATATKQAAIALGQGYSPISSCNTDYNYCGWSGTPSASNPHYWATGQYNYNDGGPGSALYVTIQDNSCLSDLDSNNGEYPVS